MTKTKVILTKIENRNAAPKGSVCRILKRISGYEMTGGVGNGPAGMKAGGVGNGPAGIKLGGVGNGPAGMKLGGVGNGPAGMKIITGGVGNGPGGMKLGGVGNGPAGMKLITGGVGNGPAGMKLGGVGNGPAGIALAVQAVTTRSPRTTTLRIFNLLVLIENSPGGGNPPDNFAKKEYPNRVMEATTKVLFKIIFHLSN